MTTATTPAPQGLTSQSSGTIKDPVTGQDIEISTVSAIGAQLDRLKDLIKAIYDAEKQQADAALKKLKWYHCARKKAFMMAVQKMTTDMGTAMQRVDKIFQTSFVPNDSVPEKLMEGHHLQWTDFMTEVDQLQADIQNQLTLQNWESSGAAQYKAALPTQLKALKELRGVAEASQQAVEQVAMLNGAIFAATEDTIDSICERLGNDLENYRPKPVKGGFLFFSSGNAKGYYYKMYDVALQLVRRLGDWMDSIVKSQGSAWAGTAENLGASIKGVESSPANLLPQGVWPQAVAQDTPEANTAALGDHRRHVDKGEGQATQGQGIKLN